MTRILTDYLLFRSVVIRIGLQFPAWMINNNGSDANNGYDSVNDGVNDGDWSVVMAMVRTANDVDDDRDYSDKNSVIVRDMYYDTLGKSLLYTSQGTQSSACVRTT